MTRGSRERYRNLLDSIPDFIFSLDLEGRFTVVNRAIDEALKPSGEEIIGKSYQELWFPVETIEEWQAMYRRVIELGEVVIAETMVPMSEGKLHNLEVTLSPIRNEKGNITEISGISHDITRHKQAEKELHMLTYRLSQAQEEERDIIARELHDNIGQSLTALGLILARLKQEMQETTTIDEAREQLKKTITDLRSLSADLHPGMLKTLGLVPTLESYLGDFMRRTGIGIDFECSDLKGENISNDISITAYRVIQEALSNIVHYAGVSRASVALRASKVVLVLEIHDQGKGFDPAMVPVTSSGLRGMRERVAAVGGLFSLESAPGKGTRIKVMLPIGVG